VKKLIFGYGTTGKSVESYFQKNNIEYLIYDDNKDINISNEFLFDDKKINEIDEVIISPGIKPNHPLLVKIKSKELRINTDIDIFNKFYNGKIIGVTGTNGKTTFVNLLTDYLNTQDIKSIAVGNVGKSPLEIIGEEYEYVVMELSSFQIYYLNNLNLHKAVVLNIYEDHLDWHRSFEDYRNAKLKILEFLPTENIKSEGYTPIRDPSNIFQDKSIRENLLKKGGILEIASKLPFHEDTLCYFIEMVYDLGINMDFINKFLSNYKTEEHRFELVDKFNEITFINDSKSTNFHSVSIATTKLNDGILVLHGLTKNISSKDLKISDKVNSILVPKDMEIDLSGTKAKLIKINSIFDIEKELIKIIKPGDTVLFSCGGASFNDFNNYEERGNFFKSVVLNIKEKYGSVK
tara:strand:+ start:40 stop:1257 length:1218 start_codon:yes stop_codon:yes gene_type:complete